MYLIKKKYIIKIISILIAIIIVPGLLLFVDWLITPNIDYSKWDKTICYIHDIGVGRSGVGKIFFNYQGRDYEFKGNAGNHEGEEYVIFVEPNNPKNFKVVQWQPVIRDSSQFIFAKGQISKIYKLWISRQSKDSITSIYGIRVTYFINNREFKIQQHLKPNIDIKKFIEGDSIPILINVNNNNIAYIEQTVVRDITK